jgi:hypothetical protein
MNNEHDIICPQCRTRHGPAAKACECGHVFESPEEAPAPASHFFIAALIFGGIAAISTIVIGKRGGVYLPLGSLLFAGAAMVLGLKSWLYHALKKKE